MRFKLGQDLIDFFRKKNSNFFYRYESFEDKITALIFSVAPFIYPETDFYQMIPNFKNSFKVSKNIFYNYKIAKSAINKLKKEFNYDGLKFTYDNLSDEFSKEMFLYVILYRVFPEIHFRFPMFYANYYQKLHDLHKLQVSSSFIDVPGGGYIIII